MKPIDVAVIGAGGRGVLAYGDFALKNPHQFRVVAVAEPDDAKRRRFAQMHGISPAAEFRGWRELIDARPRLDAVINCTQDALHADSGLAVLDAGYHQLLEKPMATNPHDSVRLVRAAKAHGRILAISHVLRYTPFFQTIKQTIDSGRLGQVAAIEHKENIQNYFFAAAWVRGPWRKRGTSNPLILSKSCHDLDILVYLLGRRAVRVSSFGSLTFFRPENAPPGATERCLDGCPAEPTCNFSAQRNYLTGQRWIRDPGLSHDQQMERLRTGNDGRCVFKMDNDVVDHQSTIIEFEGGVTVSFLLHGFSIENTRTLRVCGTHGELKGHLDKNDIRVGDFLTERVDAITPGIEPGGHHGGDWVMMRHFVAAVRSGDRSKVISDAQVSLESHLIGYAAEESRLNRGRVVEMAEYRARIEREASAPREAEAVGAGETTSGRTF